MTPPPPFTLRPATAADRDWIFAVRRATLSEYVRRTWGTWDDEAQRARFEAVYSPDEYEIVMVDGRDAGVLGVERKADEIYLGRIELLPELQGRGLGSKLLRSLMDEARAKGVPLRLQVLKVNPARRLYARLGFAVIGESETHVRMRWTSA